MITNAGYTVSCAYSFNTDEMPGTWHNNPYDSKVVSGDFLHLALVPVPRYEDATIALNSKGKEQPRNPDGTFAEILGSKMNEHKEDTKETKDVKVTVEDRLKQMQHERAMFDIEHSDKAENEINESDIIDWITVKGNHLPIRKGETKEDVAKKFVEYHKQKEDIESKNYKIRNRIEELKKSLKNQEVKLENIKKNDRNNTDLISKQENKIEYLKEQLNELKEIEKPKDSERFEFSYENLSEEEKQSFLKYRDSYYEQKTKEQQEKIKGQQKIEKQKRIQKDSELTQKYGAMKQYVDAFENAEEIQGGGYAGYSMSNRAEKAYIKGFVPKSKLTKKQQNIALELGAKEWHHSSKYANKIDFYDKNLVEMIEKNASDSDLENYLEIENEYNTSAWHNYDDDDLVKWKQIRDKYNAYNSINLDEPDARIEKDEDMKLNQLWQLFNKKEAMNKKGENEMAEKVDKRKLIDEIGGILKGKVDDELIRTIIKKAEEIGYEDSEKSADNKAKNEADEDDKKEEKAENKCAKNEDEDKKEDKKDEADNEDEDKMEEMKKAENSMDKMRKAYNSSNVQVKSLYTPQSERVELGKQLF